MFILIQPGFLLLWCCPTSTDAVHLAVLLLSHSYLTFSLNIFYISYFQYHISFQIACQGLLLSPGTIPLSRFACYLLPLCGLCLLCVAWNSSPMFMYFQNVEKTASDPCTYFLDKSQNGCCAGPVTSSFLHPLWCLPL